MADPETEGRGKRNGIATFVGWLFLLLIVSIVWPAPILTGNLPDTDDYMRMERVFGLLDGIDLPSYAVPGLGVDGKGEVGWSRLVDWPLAAIQGTLEKSMDRLSATMVTATIVPALALLAFVAAAFWYAGPLTGGRVIYTALALLCLWGLLRQFMPGRVDHHMWQVILMLLGYGALVRLWSAPARRLYPVIAGLAFGTGLAIGADIIPAMTFGTAILGLFWLVKGAPYERPGLIYGAAVSGAALAWHLMLYDPGRLWLPMCDSLSVVWLALAAAILIFWAAVALLPSALKQTARHRLVCGLAVSIPVLAALYFLFPSCFSDIYQIKYPVLRDLWLEVVMETLPLPVYWSMAPAAAAFFALPPLMALAGALWAVYRDTESRILWAGITLALGCALALTFYHMRTVDVAQAIAVAPLSWMLLAGREKLDSVFARLSRAQRLAGASVFFLLTLALFGASLMKKETSGDQKSVAAFASCDLRQAAETLNTLPGGMTIAGPIDAGSELLFRTSHNVLAASCHRNQEGILATFRIFTSPEAEALAAAEESGANVLLLCREENNFWLRHAPGENALAGSLLKGDVPAWLEPVGTPEENGNFLMFKRVD